MDVNQNIHEWLDQNGLLVYGPYLFARQDGGRHDDEGMSIADLNQKFPTWNIDSMAAGLERLKREHDAKKLKTLNAYDEVEIRKKPVLKDVRLLSFPGDPAKPSVILCAGGAYMAVCSMSEGFPVAARLQDLGYNAFVFNYRTAEGKSETYFPTPIVDLAQGVRRFEEDRGRLGIENPNYALCGFSAGANLVLEFSMEAVGYAVYGVQKPAAVFSIYGLTDLLSMQAEMANVMFGKNHDDSTLRKYDVLSNVTSDFPKTYIVACRDDDTMPVENSIRLAERLRHLEVPVETEIGEHGGHGFGNGRGTDVEGWIERAVHFWKKAI